MDILTKNKKYLQTATPQELEILNQITGGNIEAIIKYTDLETAVIKWEEKIKAREALRKTKSKLAGDKPRKQLVKYNQHLNYGGDIELDKYIKNGIDYFFNKIEEGGSRINKIYTVIRTDKTLVLNKTYNRLNEIKEKIYKIRDTEGYTDELYYLIQDYYKLSYTGLLDSVGSYTMYLLLTYTNISLPEAVELAGYFEGSNNPFINKSSLSRVRSRKRWESLHEDGFLTEEEKAEAIKDFKEIAPLVATKYDLTLTEPQEIRKN